MRKHGLHRLFKIQFGAVAQPGIFGLPQRRGRPVAVVVIPLLHRGQYLFVAFFYALLLLFQPAPVGAGLRGGG